MQAWREIAAVTIAAAANLTFVPVRPAPTGSGHFVGRQGQALRRDGSPFRFVGVNCYRLAELSDRADEILGTLAAHGVGVVRFWAFQKSCGPGGRDFRRFEAIMAAAKRHNVLLFPVLENHWNHCTYSDSHQWKPPGWYAAGWRDTGFAGAPISYREYVRAIAAHFRNEPQILAWQLVNEPEIYPETDENFSVLRRFAVDAAHELKQADPNHLVCLGLLGLGQPSTSGKKFRALQNFREIDLVSAHDHGYAFEPLAGREWERRYDSLYADLCDARSLEKPLIATESGIALEWVGGDRAHRAKLFVAKMRAFFAAGGSGYMLWNYEPSPDTDYGFGPDDPVMQVITDVAGLL